MISDNTVKTNATKDKLEEDMTKLSTEGHCRMLGGLHFNTSHVPWAFSYKQRYTSIAHSTSWVDHFSIWIQKGYNAIQ